ncbi:uncharacterized protein LOC126968381 [Leptidea sinapis]|uniref:uncharacterized protein LOC126968381 n=1 Tax=Leptidea sinapis TaxID=189913 RepID=UPI0021C31C5E|nr:uncharacterized protein LOC126968381 [Leptidea sinapis]
MALVSDPAPLPETIDDVIELISQDGDYFERMGADGKIMQCLFCEWAGPRLITEWHIQNEHIHKIETCTKPDWNITMTLGSLVGKRKWCCQIIDYHNEHYVLAAKFLEPDCLMANLMTLSSDDSMKSGSITVYNRVTGEPFSWSGNINSVPDQLPSENHAQLSVPLSKLNLLPNSANLTLINGAFITKMGNKVVVGQPELDDIQITFFSKIFIGR